MIDFTFLDILLLAVLTLVDGDRIYCDSSLNHLRNFLAGLLQSKNAVANFYSLHSLQRREFENLLTYHVAVLFDSAVVQVYLFSVRHSQFARNNLRQDQHSHSPPRLCCSFVREYLQIHEVNLTLRRDLQA